jgi:hypothetical protein
MDERTLTLALARFDGFKKNIPPSIREAVVNDYHSIVDALAAATGEDLALFKIRPDELKHKVVGVRPAGYGGGRGSTTYSSDKYCDSSRFQGQIDSLAEYLESAGHRRGSPVHSGKLSARPTTSAPTYNIGSMIGSAIQHGTRDSHVTVNYDAKSAEFRDLIGQIKTAIPKLGLEQEKANQLYIDVGTIEVQISGAAPKQSIIAECMHSIRSILEGMVGSAIASGLLPAIYKHFPK